jgi:HNH endonuclease
MAISKSKLEERRREKWEREHKVIDGVDHKICNHCHEFKPANTEYFYKGKSYDGIQPLCKACAIKKARQWEIDHPEKYQANNKKKAIVSAPIRRERARKSSAKMREEGYQKEWRNNNREKLSGYNSKRNQNKKHKISNEEWIYCKEYFDNECAYCGIHISEHFVKWSGELKWTDFHREHVDDAGANDLSNCVPSCKSCNSQKNTKSLFEWYNKENKNYDLNKLNKILKWLEEDYNYT